MKEVVEFAKSIPGFQTLSQHDQVMLLKSGTFQVRPVEFGGGTAVVFIYCFAYFLESFLMLTCSSFVRRF